MAVGTQWRWALRGPGELVPWAGVDTLPEESTAVGGRRREKGSRSARG